MIDHGTGIDLSLFNVADVVKVDIQFENGIQFTDAVNPDLLVSQNNNGVCTINTSETKTVTHTLPCSIPSDPLSVTSLNSLADVMVSKYPS